MGSEKKRKETLYSPPPGPAKSARASPNESFDGVYDVSIIAEKSDDAKAQNDVASNVEEEKTWNTAVSGWTILGLLETWKKKD